ncbi:hypothetical protein [Streptomyces sp. NBC_00878]|uniref:hypothetical protein n=1 Tax=Streptomyces sp. NBC_00878 TaxID=2975854 RepID=UPI00224F1F4E|nr:hypothetical protein [Streptomyces sp. NBC_00878]MCX4904676.1 hypothetical protein [Streptomyces sp. NBC_00878]
MSRGKTTRILFALLSVVLLALPLSTPASAFASAHVTHVMGPKSEAEFVTCDEALHPGGPTGPLRTRDRIRVADQVSQSPARSLLCKDPATYDDDPSHVAAPAAHHRTTRSSTAHSAAALQVFRC